MKIEELANEQLKAACAEFRVRELYAFGSVLSGLSDESDLDFLVQFEREGVAGAFDQFMGFKQRLEEIFRRPVDLIVLKPFRNPVFQEEVDRSKVLIYAA